MTQPKRRRRPAPTSEVAPRRRPRWLWPAAGAVSLLLAITAFAAIALARIRAEGASRTLATLGSTGSAE
ncbi:MAG TPA: hypothetical protein VF590_15010, partial [Isosphaeraceae bacterium]